MKKLPISRSSFEEIRQGNFLYIDKTAELQELLEQYKYVFLSRPRRFGKSLFVDTLHCLFEGKKELFEELVIYDQYDWSKKYPVIKLSLSGRHNSLKNSEQTLLTKLHRNAKRLGFNNFKDDLPSNFLYNLIVDAYEKYQTKVVILIDEYDKPILDNIANIEVALEIRELLQAFYGVLKDLDESIHFVFLTGVTRFSKTSIFSGLNNLVDISLDPPYATLCGYTQNDLETSFSDHLKGVDWDELRLWYNGYNFNGEAVYNPCDILLFISKKHEYTNYWFQTGTPTFLIHLIKQNRDYYKLPELENSLLPSSLLDAFDIEKIKIEPLLFQTGYLTIDTIKKLEQGGLAYSLKVPNLEVQISLAEHILEIIAEPLSLSVEEDKVLYKILLEGQMEEAKQAFQSIFAKIPHVYHDNTPLSNYEAFYSIVLYFYFRSLGAKVEQEKMTNKGRIDMVVELKSKRYLIELKMEGGKNALEQIRQKQYFQAFYDTDKELYLVGIHFDPKERNLTTFEWEKMEG